MFSPPSIFLPIFLLRFLSNCFYYARSLFFLSLILLPFFLALQLLAHFLSLLIRLHLFFLFLRRRRSRGCDPVSKIVFVTNRASFDIVVIAIASHAAASSSSPPHNSAGKTQGRRRNMSSVSGLFLLLQSILK